MLADRLSTKVFCDKADGFFPHGLIIYETILKCDKCVTEYIEIRKSFSLWCIIVNFLRQTKAKG